MRNRKSRSFFVFYLLIIALSISSTHLRVVAISSPKIHSENIDTWATFVKPDQELINPIMRVVNNSIYIVGGISGDTYLMRYDSLGIKLWENLWQGPQLEYVKCFIIDSESNLYIVGITEASYSAPENLFLLKYNNSGELLWSRVYNPFPNYDYNMISLKIGSNNSFYITGTLNNKNMFLIQIDQSGEIIWTKQININEFIVFLESQTDSENSLYLYYWGSNSTLIKYNQFGTPEWNKTWNINILPGGFQIGINDDIVITGLTDNQNYSFDIWTMKINKSGSIINSTKIEDDDLILGRIYYRDSLYDDSVYAYGSYFDHHHNIYVYLQNIYDKSFLYKIDDNLKEQWKCELSIPFLTKKMKFCCDTLQNIYLFYTNIGYWGLKQDLDIYIININNSGNITLNIGWGGENVDFLNSIAIDSQNNLYMVSTSVFVDQWDDTLKRTILVKNPQPNGSPPSLNIVFGIYDYYLFSFMGIISIISISVIISLVRKKSKPKSLN